MKYNVRAIVKEVINLTVDADSEETASELVDGNSITLTILMSIMKLNL